MTEILVWLSGFLVGALLISRNADATARKRYVKGWKQGVVAGYELAKQGIRPVTEQPNADQLN